MDALGPLGLNEPERVLEGAKASGEGARIGPDMDSPEAPSDALWRDEGALLLLFLPSPPKKPTLGRPAALSAADAKECDCDLKLEDDGGLLDIADPVRNVWESS